MSGVQNPRYQFGRTDNKDLKTIIYQDQENPIEVVPELIQDNKFFDKWSTVFNLQYTLNTEQTTKYFRAIQYQMKAEYEIMSLPRCFEECISNVQVGLNQDEKKCMINCYYKRSAVPQETSLFFMQKHAQNIRKSLLDQQV